MGQCGLGAATKSKLSPPMIGEHARQIVASVGTPKSPVNTMGCTVDIIYQLVAGLDLHQKTIVAAVRCILALRPAAAVAAYHGGQQLLWPPTALCEGRADGVEAPAAARVRISSLRRIFGPT